MAVSVPHDVRDRTLEDLKTKRAHLKANVTRIVNRLKIWLEHPEDKELCSELSKRLDERFDEFMTTQRAFHQLLTDEDDIRKALTYQNTVAAEVAMIRQQLENVEEKATFQFDDKQLEDSIQPSDSASHVSRQRSSTVSRATTVSSTASSLRLKAVAEKASLQAQAALETQRQAIEKEELQLEVRRLEEELKLVQRRRKMELQTKIAMAEAVERTYAEAQEIETPSVRFMQSTPHLSDDKRQPALNVQAAQTTDVPDADVSRHYPEFRRRSSNLPSTIASNDQVSDILIQMLNNSHLQQQSLVETLQLPKTELMTFDGDPVKYWTFIRAFENIVDKETVGDGAKLARLLQYCTGPARKLIQCCSVKEPREGYLLARKLLQSRFGNAYDISDAWINKIVGRPIITDNRELLEFSDELRNCRETLHAMGKLVELNNRQSLAKIIEKLPYDLRKSWLNTVHRLKFVENRLPSIDDVLEFVSVAAERANDPVFGKLLHANRPDKARKNVSSKEHWKNKPHANFNTQVEQPSSSKAPCTPKDHQLQSPPAIGVTAGVQRTTATVSCPYCALGHNLFGCTGWKALKVTDRLKFVQRNQLCVNCLQSGHRARNCQKGTVCTVPGCGLKHTKFLHLLQPKSTTVSNAGSRPPSLSADAVPFVSTSAAPQTSGNVTCTTTGAGVGKVVLPIVPVKVKAEGSSKFITTYALLDTGSTQTFCSKALTKALGILGTLNSVNITTLDNYNTPTDTFLVNLEVTDINNENLVVMRNVLTRPRICVDIDHLVTREEMAAWPHLQDITIPDVSPSDVLLIIGLDNPTAVAPKEVREGGDGTPYATKTIFGWTLNGPIRCGPNNQVISHFIDADTRLQHQVEKFWSMEELGGGDVSMSVSDRKTIGIWEQSIHKENGHYSMDIPFKSRPPCLPDNKAMAEHRLRLLGRRLTKDPAMKDKYATSIKELMEKGYAEEVSQEQLDRADGAVWYLPHHPVFHPHKPEKLRIVFDCAAKFQGLSLNDMVHRGPDLTNKLVGVLLRFRQERVAFMADIEAMFHQVLVNQTDRDVLRFLWWSNDDISCAPKIYRMVAHLFGGVWSPSCANFALKHTAQDNIDEYDEETVRTVDRNFYVDDCLKSVATEADAIRLIDQLKSMLSLGGFNLRKWISNSREILQEIPATEKAKTVTSLDLDRELLPTERALGVLWDIENDVFTFDVHVTNKPLTRRGLLSTVSSVYDPLGYASPFILTAKMLFQELCRKKIGWDDTIPDEVAQQWRKWLADLPELKHLSVPRCIKPQEFGVNITAQLHHFCDASERGYGAATYLRIKDTHGRTSSSLLMAKSKLAPLKKTTIPRLELASGVLAAKLDVMIRQELSLQLQESVFWSDSMIVLHYLRNEEKRYQTFVANRIAKILESSKASQWKYIDSSSNPADDVSRGLTAYELIKSDRWVPGPRYLQYDEPHWPCQPDFDRHVSIDDLEVKKDPVVYCTDMSDDEPNALNTLFSHYSSWYQLRKAVAWILRVKTFLLQRIRKGCSNIKPDQPISVDELSSAECAIVRHVQHTSFDKVTLKSRCFKKLGVSASDPGLLRVGGRLGNANLTEDVKHPWILPKNHPVVTLIIRHYHVATGHSGAERTLAEIRQRFWIVKGRSSVKRIIHKCIPCRKMKAPTLTQQMSDLPADRVEAGQAPFSFVGVDMFGPFMVKRARSVVKRYGCLFTCLSIRAIHVEICHSLDTDSFLNALQRFICRRGTPIEVRSDNGTNFVGGNRELRQAIMEWNQNKIHDYLLQREIPWIFNPPSASHFGGVWERQIRTVRSVLSSLLNQQVLTDEGLQTLMCIVEAIINGRPITRLSDDPRDLSPLTPNHLLLLRSGPSLPPGQFTEQDIYRRRWRQIQYLADIFWKRWLKEYLPSLQARQKWTDPKRNIRIGDLVLVKNETTPRHQWPLGLVVDTHPGKDGRVRSARVKTQTGLYLRPIDKLCLLEGYA